MDESSPFQQMLRKMYYIMDDYLREVSRRGDEEAIAPYWDGTDCSILHDANEAHQVVNDDEKFAVALDVSQFRPEELKVNLHGRVLTVEGMQECRDDDSYMTRSFVRSWTLPENTNLAELHSVLDDQGRLIIEVPKDEVSEERKEIPIRSSRCE